MTRDKNGIDKFVRVSKALMDRTTSTMVSMQDHVNFDALTKGMLLDEETILGQPIPYNSAIGRHATNGTSTLSLPNGNVVLTNQRLLFVSATASQNLWATKKVQTQTNVSFTVQDNCRYFPVALNLTRHVSMEIFTKATQHSTVTETPGGCCCCTYTNWTNSTPISVPARARCVKMGILLPPWNTATDLTISFTPTASLEEIRSFVHQVETVQTSSNPFVAQPPPQNMS